MSQQLQLQGQVALVTGASRGIGRAIATALAQAGAKVIGTATTASGAESISAYLKEVSALKLVLAMALNVNDAAACSAATIDQIQKEYGSISILVNNAGITQDQLAMRMKDEEWDSVIATNSNFGCAFVACGFAWNDEGASWPYH